MMAPEDWATGKLNKTLNIRINETIFSVCKKFI